MVSRSKPPRDEARIVPPWWWQSAVLSMVSMIGSYPAAPEKPLYPPLERHSRYVTVRYEDHNTKLNSILDAHNLLNAV
jgi:hypothetical protein